MQDPIPPAAWQYVLETYYNPRRIAGIFEFPWMRSIQQWADAQGISANPVPSGVVDYADWERYVAQILVPENYTLVVLATTNNYSVNVGVFKGLAIHVWGLDVKDYTIRIERPHSQSPVYYNLDSHVTQVAAIPWGRGMPDLDEDYPSEAENNITYDMDRGDGM